MTFYDLLLPRADLLQGWHKDIVKAGLQAAGVLPLP